MGAGRRRLAAAVVVIALLIGVSAWAADSVLPRAAVVSDELSAPLARLTPAEPPETPWCCRRRPSRWGLPLVGLRPSSPSVRTPEHRTEPRADRRRAEDDASLRCDAACRREHQLYYIELSIEPLSGTEAAAIEPEVAEAAPFPLADTFKLHSLPGAKLTILIDFGPRTMTNNAWTQYQGRANTPINCPVWSLDDDPAFSDAEKTAIQEVWQRVAED